MLLSDVQPRVYQRLTGKTPLLARFRVWYTSAATQASLCICLYRYVRKASVSNSQTGHDYAMRIAVQQSIRQLQA